MSISRILEKASKTEDYYQRVRLCSQGIRLVSSVLPFKQKEHFILNDWDLPGHLITSAALAEGPVNSVIYALFYKFKKNQGFLVNWVKQAENILVWDPEKAQVASLHLREQLRMGEKLKLQTTYLETSNKNGDQEKESNGFVETPIKSKSSNGMKMLKNVLINETKSTQSKNSRLNNGYLTLQDSSNIGDQLSRPFPSTDRAITERSQEKIQDVSTRDAFIGPEYRKYLARIKKLAFNSGVQAIQNLKEIQNDMGSWFSLVQFTKKAMNWIPFNMEDELDKVWDFFQTESALKTYKLNKKDIRSVEKAYKKILSEHKKARNSQESLTGLDDEMLKKFRFGGILEADDLEEDSESDDSSVDTQEKEDALKRQTDRLLRLQKKQEVQIKLESLLFSVEKTEDSSLTPEIMESFLANPLYAQTIVDFLVRPFGLKVEESPSENLEFIETFSELDLTFFEFFEGSFEKLEGSQATINSPGISKLGNVGSTSKFSAVVSHLGFKKTKIGKSFNTPTSLKGLKISSEKTEVKLSSIGEITDYLKSQSKKSPVGSPKGQQLIRLHTTLQMPQTFSGLQNNSSKALSYTMNNPSSMKTMKFSPKANSPKTPADANRLSIQTKNPKFKITRKPTNSSEINCEDLGDNEIVFRSFRVFGLLVHPDNYEFFSQGLRTPIQSMLLKEFVDVLGNKTEEPRVLVPHVIKLFEFYLMRDPEESIKMIFEHNLILFLLPSIDKSLVSSFLLSLLSPSDSWLKLGIKEKVVLWDHVKKFRFFMFCEELLISPQKRKTIFEWVENIRKESEGSGSVQNIRRERSNSQKRSNTVVIKPGQKGKKNRPEENGGKENKNLMFFSQSDLGNREKILDSYSFAPDIDLIESTIRQNEKKHENMSSFGSLSNLSQQNISMVKASDTNQSRGSKRRLTCGLFTLYSPDQKNKKQEFKMNTDKANLELEQIRLDMSQVLYPDTNKYRDHPVFAQKINFIKHNSEYSLAVVQFIKATIENLVNFNSSLSSLSLPVPPGILDSSITDTLFFKEGKLLETLFRCYLTSFNSSFSKNQTESMCLASGEAVNLFLKYFKTLQRKEETKNLNETPEIQIIDKMTSLKCIKMNENFPKETESDESHCRGKTQKHIEDAKKISFFYFHLLQKIIIDHHVNVLMKKAKNGNEKLGVHRMLLIETYLAILELDFECKCIVYVTPRCMHVFLCWCFIFSQNSVFIRMIARIFNILIARGEEYTLTDILVRLNIGSLFSRVYSIHDNFKVVPTFELIFFLIDEIVKTTIEKLEGNIEPETLKKEEEQESQMRSSARNIVNSWRRSSTIGAGKNGEASVKEENEKKREVSKPKEGFVRSSRARMGTRILRNKRRKSQEESENDMKVLKEFVANSKCWELLKKKVFELKPKADSYSDDYDKKTTKNRSELLKMKTMDETINRRRTLGPGTDIFGEDLTKSKEFSITGSKYKRNSVQKQLSDQVNPKSVFELRKLPKIIPFGSLDNEYTEISEEEESQKGKAKRLKTSESGPAIRLKTIIGGKTAVIQGKTLQPIKNLERSTQSEKKLGINSSLSKKRVQQIEDKGKSVKFDQSKEAKAKKGQNDSLSIGIETGSSKKSNGLPSVSKSASSLKKSPEAYRIVSKFNTKI